MRKKDKKKYILALDQSTSCTGFSYWDNDGTFLDSGKLEIKSANLEDMIILIMDLFDKYKPDTVVIEDIFYSPSGGKSFATLAKLQGIIIGICIDRKIEYEIVQAKTWKKAFGIQTNKTKRNKQKQECQNIVKQKFNLDVNTDEADSIGFGNWYFCKA